MMSNSIPSINIVIPAYNASQYISESIESILNQTFYDFELIIIDDDPVPVHGRQSRNRCLRWLDGNVRKKVYIQRAPVNHEEIAESL
jgi:cellulose synthase/poly-beta-1,6-N-acetylglucosamine synthase-like glycosyltransferase